MNGPALVVILLVAGVIVFLMIKLKGDSVDPGTHSPVKYDPDSGDVLPPEIRDPEPKTDVVDYLSGVTDSEYAVLNNCRICSRCETMAPAGSSVCPVCGKKLAG